MKQGFGTLDAINAVLLVMFVCSIGLVTVGAVVGFAGRALEFW